MRGEGHRSGERSGVRWSSEGADTDRQCPCHVLPSVRATVGSVQAGKVKGQALSDHPSLSLCPQLELQATGAHP